MSSLSLCRFHLHNQWPTTFFILNLAFSDLLYCTFSLTMYAYEYFQMKWNLGLLFCKLLATFRYIISYSCWISVAMIAVTRCISITKPGQPTVFSHKKYRRFICALIWLFAIAIVLPTYFEVTKLSLFHRNNTLKNQSTIYYTRSLVHLDLIAILAIAI